MRMLHELFWIVFRSPGGCEAKSLDPEITKLGKRRLVPWHRPGTVFFVLARRLLERFCRRIWQVYTSMTFLQGEEEGKMGISENMVVNAESHCCPSFSRIKAAFWGRPHSWTNHDQPRYHIDSYSYWLNSITYWMLA